MINEGPIISDGTTTTDEHFGVEPSPDIKALALTAQRIKDEVHRCIVGKDDLLETLLVCLLAEGHVLIHGNPGLAKTTIAKLFARTMGCSFNRQQFTPDIVPSDVTGTYVFNQKTGDFEVRKGGIFSNIVLVDEINRAAPRTQAALLESMQERNVTIEGTTFPLERPFIVIATESSIEGGTYTLPEVELDRFMVKVIVDYPSPEEELQLLSTNGVSGEIHQIADREEVVRMIDAVKDIYVDDKVLQYIRDLVVGTRTNPDVLLPASPRASLALLAMSKALAAMRCRDYVTPDDVKRLVPKVLNHRIMLAPDAELDGLTIDKVIEDLLAATSIN